MKRWVLLSMAITFGALGIVYRFASAEARSAWLDPASAISVQALQLNNKPDVYCHQPSEAVSSLRLVGCFDGTVYSSQSNVESSATAMSFGSLTHDGVFSFGSLPYDHHIKLPEHYQLFPIAHTNAALLIDDGKDDHASMPVAYYPDVSESIDWLQLRLQTPVTSQYFKDDVGQLEVSPFGLASSRNGRWVVAYSTYHGMVRLDLSGHQFNTIDLGYRLQIGGRYVKPVPATAITDDGATAFLGYTDDVGGTQIYDTRYPRECANGDTSGDCPRRNITETLKTQIPNYVYTAKIDIESDNTIVVTAATSQTPNLSFARYRLAIGPVTQYAQTYIALGDSFASGEGAYLYHPETDQPPNKCHLSNASFPYLLSVSARSVACSGARLKDVNGSVWGQRTGRPQADYAAAEIGRLLSDFTPGNLNQLAFIEHYHPAVATVMIGGNDVGFSGLLKECIDPRRTIAHGLTCYPTYEDRLELIRSAYDQYDNFKQTFKRLQAASDETTLYAIGYPQVISQIGSCGVNVQLNDTERALAIAMIDALNLTLARAAAATGVHFVDTSQAFEGHMLCQSGQPAMNGITSGDDGLSIAGRYLLGQESFHPTAYGQQLLAQTIHAQTNGLKLGRISPVPTAKPDTSPLFPIFQGLVQTGRALRTRLTDQSIAPDVSGGQFVIAVSNDAYQLKPHQPISIYIGDQQHRATTDAHGGVYLSTSLQTSGYQSIHVYATDQSGNELDITKVIYVVADNPDASLTLQVGQTVSQTSSDK